MFKSLLIALATFAAAFNPLQRASQNVDIASSLVMHQGWVHYPSYSDRDGWATFLGEYQDDLSDDGLEFIGYTWQDITEEDYLAYVTMTAIRWKISILPTRGLWEIFS